MATETGTTLKSVNLDLSQYYIILVYPEIHISTAEAYSGITPGIPETSLEEIIISKPVHEWKNLLKNDLENSLFPKYPLLEEIKNTFYEHGAVYSSMTGSGSTIYGLFSHEVENPFEGKGFKSYSSFL